MTPRPGRRHPDTRRPARSIGVISVISWRHLCVEVDKVFLCVEEAFFWTVDGEGERRGGRAERERRGQRRHCGRRLLSVEEANRRQRTRGDQGDQRCEWCTFATRAGGFCALRLRRRFYALRRRCFGRLRRCFVCHWMERGRDGRRGVPSARGVGRGAIVGVRPSSGSHVLQEAFLSVEEAFFLVG